eukprot:Rmarinus@m.29739
MQRPKASVPEGHSVVRVAGDGHCLYRSLHVCRHRATKDHPTGHQQVRNDVLEYLDDHPDVLLHSDEIDEFDPNDDTDEVIRERRKQVEDGWGGLAAITACYGTTRVLAMLSGLRIREKSAKCVHSYFTCLRLDEANLSPHLVGESLRCSRTREGGKP